MFGGSVYDGVFNVNAMEDPDLVVRIYAALSAFVPNPKHVLVLLIYFIGTSLRR